ncbi:MAG: hypothetical protein R3F61_22285 [Myxococcota bacterium]
MIWWLLALAQAAPCELEGPADGPFMVQAPDDAPNVMVVLALHVSDADLDVAWAKRLLAVLDERGLKAGLSIKARAPSAALEALVIDAAARGHEIVARLSEAQIPRNPTSGPRELRKNLKPLTSRFGRLKSAEAPLGDRSGEAVLHRIGLRAVLETNGPATGTPRTQMRFEGQPESGVVLPSGPYSGKCGGESVVNGLTPPAADRVTQALYGARSGGAGIVRLTLDPASDDDSVVLARWLDEVVKPAGIAVVTPQQAREASLRSLRSGTVDSDGSRTEGGRLVRVDEVQRAAAALAEVKSIPRMLPGDLTPTEAFQAFLLVLIGEVEGSVVRLGALDGPSVLSKSTLTGPTPIDREALVSLAKTLHAELPESIPAALPVGGTLLTAPELLVALASALGEGPVEARPVGVPEPNAAGLGWGRATTP